MILEHLSETTRQELEALTPEAKRALASDLMGEPPPDLDPVVREFLNRIEKGPPLLDSRADVVALIREGRRE